MTRMNNVDYKPLHFHCKTYLVHTMRLYICEIRFENQVKDNQKYTYQKNFSSDFKVCLKYM
jgi:hypothetical protein